jgi:formate hydrogenlyase subunit 6/NADH:ubiquinone oxidoreductase subunit I
MAESLSTETPSTETLSIQIDGRECRCEKGEYLAAVARRNGIFIPTLCGSREALAGSGCCRVCVVEVVERGRVKVVASCIYPVASPIEVFTASERIVRERGIILGLLARLAPDSALIAQMAKSLQAPEMPRLKAQDKGGSCILCGLCVNACSSLGAGAIAAAGRGVAKEVTTAFGEPAAACVGCASCAQVCPTGAIALSDDGHRRTIWGKSFELVRCEVCGEPLDTPEALALAAQKAGREPERLCPAHRRRRTADALASVYSPRAAAHDGP